MVNAMPWPIYPKRRDPVSIVQEAGWAHSQSKWVPRISPLLEFNPCTILAQGVTISTTLSRAKKNMLLI
jgi:hypothetical protein